MTAGHQPTPAPPPRPVMPLGYVPADYQAVKDDEHLKLLALFHYIYGGLTMAMSCLALIHITIGIMAVTGGFTLPAPSGPPGSTGPTGPGGGPPPAAFQDATFGWFFIAIGSAILLLGWTLGILTILSGRSIKRRRRHLFSLIVAGVCCVNVPLGTALGVFTFIVLLRDSVKAQYAAAR